MERKKVLIWISVAVALAALIVGVGLALNSRKAVELQLPEVEEVVTVEVATPDTASQMSMSSSYYQEYIADLLTALEDSEPTAEQSENDQPTGVEEYDTIKVTTADEVYVLYVYERNGTTYVEVPYQGIYKADDGLLQYLENIPQ